MMNSAGFEESQHTADWALHVWAPTMISLFEQAARGLNALAGIQLALEPRFRKEFVYSGIDTESLLVGFLSELVYEIEQEGHGFDSFDIHIEGYQLQVVMDGAPLVALTKAIKAVTFHNLKIQKDRQGFDVEIVLDV